MRLYCSHCGSTCDEPYDWFASHGGRPPCRNCGAPLAPGDAAKPASPRSKTAIVVKGGAAAPAPSTEGKTLSLTLPSVGNGAGAQSWHTPPMPTPGLPPANAWPSQPGSWQQPPPQNWQQPQSQQQPAWPPQQAQPQQPGWPSPSQQPGWPPQAPQAAPGGNPWGAPQQPAWQQTAPPSAPTAQWSPSPAQVAPAPSSPAPYLHTGPRPVASPPSGPASSSNNPGGFHNQATFIFNPAEMVAGAGGAPAGEKTSLLDPRMADGPGRATPDGQKRRVVVGGAASSATNNLTQTYDVSVLGPAKGAPALAAAPRTNTANRLVVSAGANPIGPDQTQSVAPRTRSSALPLIIVFVFILLLASTVLSMFGVLPNPGFLPRLGGSPTPDTPSVPSQVSLDNLPQAATLLGRVRSLVVPAFVSAGDTPTGHGLALASLIDPSGAQRYWVSAPSHAQPTEIDGNALQTVGEGNLPVYLLFDHHTDATTLIRTLDTLRLRGLPTFLVGASTAGNDVFHVFRTDAPQDAALRAQLTSRAVMLLLPGAAAPTPVCYSGLLPTDQIRSLVSAAATQPGQPFDVLVELAPGVTVQAVLNLAQGLYREGLRLHLAVGGSITPPAECP